MSKAKDKWSGDCWDIKNFDDVYSTMIHSEYFIRWILIRDKACWRTKMRDSLPNVLQLILITEDLDFIVILLEHSQLSFLQLPIQQNQKHHLENPCEEIISKKNCQKS